MQTHFDGSGNETYSVYTDGKLTEEGNEEAEKKFDEMFAELEETNVIEFETVE